jgi:hypothetical protein
MPSIIVKMQTTDRFGSVLQSTDDAAKMPTLKDYCDAGWEVVCVTAEGAAAALVALRREDKTGA